MKVKFIRSQLKSCIKRPEGPAGDTLLPLQITSGSCRAHLAYSSDAGKCNPVHDRVWAGAYARLCKLHESQNSRVNVNSSEGSALI